VLTPSARGEIVSFEGGDDEPDLGEGEGEDEELAEGGLGWLRILAAD
jgi:hypothetical protein